MKKPTTWKRFAFSLLVVLPALALLNRCGESEDRKKKTTTPTTSELIPSGWDGQSDWDNSDLTVKDDY